MIGLEKVLEEGGDLSSQFRASAHGLLGSELRGVGGQTGMVG